MAVETENEMKTLFLQWHLGLGDAILCNGLVRVLAVSHGAVVVPAKKHNVDTVEWMFSDVPNIIIASVKDDNDMHLFAEQTRIGKGAKIVGLGLWSKRGLQHDKWDQGFYEDAGVPFECRWSEFKLPDEAHLVPEKANLDWVSHWCFIHDDVKRGYRIRAEKLPPIHEIGNYFPYQGISIDEHTYEMQRSTEIHVIDSCFLALADSIETSAKRHVLHLYATAHDPYKKFGPPALRKAWEILR